MPEAQKLKIMYLSDRKCINIGNIGTLVQEYYHPSYKIDGQIWGYFQRTSRRLKLRPSKKMDFPAG